MPAGSGQIGVTVNESELKSSIDRSVALISGFENKIDEASGKVISVKVDLSGAENLADLTGSLKSIQTAVNALIPVQNDYKRGMGELNAITSQYDANMGEALLHYTNLKSQIDKNNESIRQYKASIEANNDTMSRMSAVGGKNVEILTAMNAANQQNQQSINSLIVSNKLLQTQIVESNAVISGAVDKRVAKEIEGNDKKILAQQKADIKAIESANKRASAEQAAYDKQVLAAQRAEITQVESATKKASAEQAAAEKMILAAQKAEIAQVNAAVKSANAIEASAQKEIAAREKATYAYKVQQQFYRVATRMPALLAEIAIFTALFAAGSALIDLFKILVGQGEEVIKIKEAWTQYEEELKHVGDQIDDVIEKEQLLNSILLKTASNTAISFDKRTEAMEKYREAYGHLLDRYTDEQIANKDNAVVLATQDADRLKREEEVSKQRLEAHRKETEALNKQESELRAKYVNTGSLHFIDKEGINAAIKEVQAKKYKLEHTSNGKEQSEPITKQLEDEYVNKEGAYQQYINNNDNENLISKLKGEITVLENKMQRYDYEKHGVTDQTTAKEIREKRKEIESPEYSKMESDYIQKKQELDELLNPKDKKGAIAKRPRNLVAYTGEEDDEMARYKTEAEIQKKLVEDTKSSVEERLQANLKYSAAMIQIAEAQRRKEQEINRVKTLNEVKNAPNNKEAISAKENGKKEEKAIDEKYNTETVKLATESAKRVGEIWANSEEQLINNSKEALEQGLAVIEDGYIQKEQLLKQRLKAHLIDGEQYNKDRKKLQKAYNDESIQYEIDFLTKLLSSTDAIIQKHHTEIEKRIRALKKSQLGEDVTERDLPSGALPELEGGATSFRKANALSDDIANESDPEKKKDLQKEQLQNQLEGIAHYISQATDIYTQFYAAIKQIRDNAFQQEELQLQIKLQQVELSSKQQIDAIEATTNYQITKDNEVSKLTAQTTAEENSLQQQQNALKLKQAKADKQAAETSVILNTAKGIAAVLPLFGAVATIPLAIAEIAIITAIGAAQYAAAASTPLPQFWTGGTTETPIFEAGERGRELMITPSGDISIAEKQGIYGAPIGTEIYNAYDTKRILDYAQNHTGQMHTPIIIENNNDLEKFAKMLGDKFEDSMQDMTIAVLKSNTRPIKVKNTVNIYHPLQRK